MKKQSTIAITLGVSIVMLAIATNFLPLQQLASAQPSPVSPPASPAAAGSNMTAGTNMTGPASSLTGGAPDLPPPANPARGPQDKFLTDEPKLVSPAGSSPYNWTAENMTGTENVILASPVGDADIKDPSCSITK